MWGPYHNLNLPVKKRVETRIADKTCKRRRDSRLEKIQWLLPIKIIGIKIIVPIKIEKPLRLMVHISMHKTLTKNI